MPLITTDDGVRLHVEEVGRGVPIIFVHEFAGDHRSWEPQLSRFARSHRCIAFSARGYPPSGVPEAVEAYSQERARDDIRAVLDALGIERAHVVGLSMGAYATLHFGLDYPERALSLVLAGCGHGSEPEKRAVFAAEAEAAAERLLHVGMPEVAAAYAESATRVQLQNKDPRGWAGFRDRLAEHSALGSANTLRGLQGRRPSLYDLAERLPGIELPTLVITGDEDWHCLEPGLLLKRSIATAALAVLPNAGHTLNLEEPDAFNRLLADFLQAVDGGTWPRRDPRALADGVLGMK